MINNKLISKLEGVRSTGDGRWIARCPHIRINPLPPIFKDRITVSPLPERGFGYLAGAISASAHVMINPLPEKQSCKLCKITYYLSKTSHKELCGICSTFPRLSQKSILKTDVGALQGGTIKTANFSNCRPESSGLLRGESCLCTVCGEIFEKVNGFDKHRTVNPENRRCITPDEMREKGMVINSYGRWGTCKFDVMRQQDTAA